MADKSAPAKSEFFPIEDVHNGAIDAEIDKLIAQNREIYFGCATFKDGRGQRSAKNTFGYKCFRADIDCGPSKEYPTQKKALYALQKYLEEIGLPMPTIVNSGRGWHLYWALDEVIEYNVWRPIADALKSSMADLQFFADPSVTADGARILRIPDTLNSKDREAIKPVEIIKAADPISLEAFTNHLTAYLVGSRLGEEIVAKTNTAVEDPLMKKLIENSESNFSRILARSLKETEITETVEVIVEAKDGTRTTKQTKQKVIRSAGCAQIAHIYQAQSDPEFDYNLWRAGLSIAANCNDADEAIAIISNQYPGYDPDYTAAVARDTKGKPQYCKTFQGFNPTPCLTCPIKGQISTPIQLGAVIIPATPTDNLKDQVWHRGLKEYVSIEIPITYPSPWFRPKVGGVAYKGALQKEAKKDAATNDGEENEGLIYEHDLWVNKRLIDPTFGEVVQISVHLPKDGLAEFMVPLSYLAKPEKCQEFLASNGVVALGKSMRNIQMYLMDWVKYYQLTNKAEQAREQMGWHDNYSRFLIGSREITSDGLVIYSPPCSLTEEIAPLYSAKGDLDAWKTVVNTYNNIGNEARAFAFFVSMGSPLYTFCGVGSMLVHLTNSASGVGKSTAQMVGASIWGHPVMTMLNENDTAMAKQQRAGVLGNIAIMFDELTNMSGEETSDFVFRFSFNRGRNRMQSQINAERKNSATWSMPGITSGNNSLHDVLKAFKTSSEGEMFRVMEIQVYKDETLTKEQSDYLFNELLLNNYGIAGETFMKYVVPNQRDVVKRLLEVQKEFDKAAGFGQKERFYSACCAAAFTGAEIAYKLGLHNIDVERIKQWAIKTFGKMAKHVEATSTDNANDVLGQFLNEHIRNTMVINSNAGMTHKDSFLPALPTVHPAGELVIRYEPDTHFVYVARAKLQSWCAERRIPYAPMWNKLLASDVAKKDTKMCLSKGSSLPGTPVWVVCLDGGRLNWNIDTATITQ